MQPLSPWHGVIREKRLTAPLVALGLGPVLGLSCTNPREPNPRARGESVRGGRARASEPFLDACFLDTMRTMVRNTSAAAAVRLTHRQVRAVRSWRHDLSTAVTPTWG